MVLKLLEWVLPFHIYYLQMMWWFFSKANTAKANVILKCLTMYSCWSGQCINQAKSAIFFSKNCKPAIKASVNSVLKLPPIPACAKYLGIPLFILKKKNESFSELKDRIFAKVTSWKARLLSYATRTTLIKSVLNAIPTYIMSLSYSKDFLCKDWLGFEKILVGLPTRKKA